MGNRDPGKGGDVWTARCGRCHALLQVGRISETFVAKAEGSGNHTAVRWKDMEEPDNGIRYYFPDGINTVWVKMDEDNPSPIFMRNESGEISAGIGLGGGGRRSGEALSPAPGASKAQRR